MMYKQPALGSAILWGDGVLQGDSIVSGENLIWDCNVGSTSILETVSSTWAPAFMDPTSIAISDEKILIYGELGAPTGVRLASASSVYYPVVR